MEFELEDLRSDIIISVEGGWVNDIRARDYASQLLDEADMES